MKLRYIDGSYAIECTEAEAMAFYAMRPNGKVQALNSDKTWKYAPLVNGKIDTGKYAGSKGVPC
jgi:hypothetical protein